MKHANGSECVTSPGPWAQLVKVRGCICSDGVARTAVITGQPDTAFSIPARVSVRGKSVTGFVTTAPDYRPGVLEGFIFHANKFGKNAGMLPENHSYETADN